MCFTETLRNDQQLGQFFCKQHLKDIGYNIYFLHSNDVDRALAYYRSALKVTNRDSSLMSEDLSESLDLFRLIANACRRKGQYESAYRYFQRAFDQMRPGINETGVLNSSPEELKRVKKIHYLTGLIIDKGDSYRSQFDVTKDPGALIEAIRIYKVADQFLNKIKTEQTEYNQTFLESDWRLYENAIEACYLQHNLKMLFIFEKPGGTSARSTQRTTLVRPK